MIVTNEATLQLTIPASIKSSTKDLANTKTYDEEMVYQKVNLTKVQVKVISFVPVGFLA